MSISTSAEVKRLQNSLKWLWVGPVGGIACMVALVIFGLVTQTPGMTVMAASLAAALGGVWAALHASMRNKITKARRS